MNTAVIQTRVDAKLKVEADSFFQSIGLDTTSAIRMFLSQTLIQQKIPFEIVSKESVDRKNAWNNFMQMQSQASAAAGMSLDEINAEIALARMEKK